MQKSKNFSGESAGKATSLEWMESILESDDLFTAAQT